ncbi:MAG: small basic family protein [Bacillota bacterium]
MWMGIWIAVLGLALGIALGLNLPFTIPQAYAKYMSVAALAALDSVFGGIRAAMEDHYDNKIFITGFFSNALLAAGLAFIGERLGIDLYLAAVVAFGVRLFQNLAIIRRHLLKNKN